MLALPMILELMNRRVSKDGRWHDLACGGPSRRASKFVADFGTIGCQSQAGLTLVRAPPDKADIDMMRTSETTCQCMFR
jgi:hypothetical protein